MKTLKLTHADRLATHLMEEAERKKNNKPDLARLLRIVRAVEYRKAMRLRHGPRTRAKEQRRRANRIATASRRRNR